MRKLHDTSPDVVLYILTFCDLDTIISYSQTCNEANDLINNMDEELAQYLWQQLFERWKVPPLSLEIDWKSQFKHISKFITHHTNHQ
jgi:hypothetical protein